MTGPQLLAMLGVTAGPITADSTDTHNLTWTFNSGSQAFDYLAAGQSLVLSYTIESTDNHGASDTQTVTITITGTNDAPVAVADSNGGDAVTETGVNPGNTPFAGDPARQRQRADQRHRRRHRRHQDGLRGQRRGANVGAPSTGTYGTLTLAADGSWTYTLDNADADTNALAQGAAGTDVFTYTVTDANGGTSLDHADHHHHRHQRRAGGGGRQQRRRCGHRSRRQSGQHAVPRRPVATGNVLTNDTDVDTGDTKTVRGQRLGANVGAAVTRHLRHAHARRQRQLDLHARQRRPDTNALAQGADGDRRLHLHGGRRQRRHLARPR